jgi:hypothetical protein
MVLADAERVDPDLVREHPFGDDVAQRVRLGDELTGGVDRDVAEGVETELES